MRVPNVRGREAVLRLKPQVDVPLSVMINFVVNKVQHAVYMRLRRAAVEVVRLHPAQPFGRELGSSLVGIGLAPFTRQKAAQVTFNDV